jgi:tRNA threonylcarbamoyladenosine biosynthesis protein TsaB
MNVLAIDTCESRGSVALLRDTMTFARIAHEGNQDYSAWLLPAVDKLLHEAHTSLAQIELFVVATGPGSFTGLRVGLTTVKAWAEVYRKPVVGVSRLEALARSCNANSGLVAASYDAYRGQLFGGLYRLEGGLPMLVGDELVISPQEFLELVGHHAGDQAVTWVSLDPEMVTSLETWKQREAHGDTMRLGDAVLAPIIAEIAEELAARGEFSDPLLLDANYVRRSDAEIFWKRPAGNVR